MLRRQVLSTLIWNLGTVAAGLLNGVLLARWLGPSVRGEVAAALLWPTLLISLASFGMFPAITYFAAQRQVSPGRMVGTAGVLSLSLGLLSGLVGYCAVPMLLASQSSDVISAARVYLFAVPLGLVCSAGMSVALSSMNVNDVNLLRAIIPVGYLCGTVVLGLTGQLGVLNLILLLLGLNLVVLVGAVMSLGRRGLLRGFGVDAVVAPKLLQYGAKIHVGTVGGMVSQHLATTLLAALFSPTALGLYVTAANAAGVIQTLAQAVQLVALPAIAQDAPIEQRTALLERFVRHYFTVSVLAAPLFILLLPPLILTFFGRAFSGAIIPSMILAIGCVLAGCREVLITGAQASNKPWLGSAVYWLGALATVSLLPPLLSRWGIVGAAVATAAVSALQLTVTVLSLKRSIGMSPRSAFRVAAPETIRLIRGLFPLLKPTQIEAREAVVGASSDQTTSL